jgi:hypothetical protein
MSTALVTRNVLDEKLNKPKLYTVLLKVVQDTGQLYLCKDCFSELFESFPGRQLLLPDLKQTKNLLNVTGKCYLYKPITKDIAETYHSAIEAYLKLYNESHDSAELISEIESI